MRAILRERETETEGERKRDRGRERERERKREREKKRKPLLFSFSGDHLQVKANLGSAGTMARPRKWSPLGAACE